MAGDPIHTLMRVSTDYSDLEDRLRLSGEIKNGPPVVLWLTQRLTGRLLPLLVKWLDKQTDSSAHKDMLHDFAQQAARADLKPQAPVRPATDGETYLVHAVNVVRNKDKVTLVFRVDDVPRARFVLTSKQLRQWLSILHAAWTKAHWAAAPWPDWIEPETRADKQQTQVH